MIVACVLAAPGQALGQAPEPPQPKRKPVASKPVRLTPPPAKPKPLAKPVPSSGAVKTPKPPPKPALKVFPRKREKFNFIGGDRVLLVGDGLIEQAQKHGYLEYRITVQNSGKKLYFHNIGWSGDTPAGIARDGLGTRQAGHEPANEGWLQLSRQVADIKPTVAIIGYGMASSLDGSTLEQFKSDYQRLVAHIKANAGKKNRLRLVFMTPIAHENLGGKLPSGEAHNAILEKYRDAIGDMAKEHDAWFVDLYRYLKRRKGSTAPVMTADGIHLTDYGYWVMAGATEFSFSWSPTNFRFGIMQDGTERGGGYGIKLGNISKTDSGVTLDGKFDGLPPYFGREKKGTLITQQTAIGRVQILGLPEGRFTLAADGEEVLTAETREWRQGAYIDAGPDVGQAEKIRRLIREKNELYFHRTRPQNQAYLWGFRKHEQGNNFKEVPMFDPLIRKKEEAIFAMNKPVQRKYRLMPAEQWERSKPDEVATKGEAETEAKPFKPQPLPEFDLGDGLEITLFAQNPLLAKPIQMNFDAKGRLWVASSEVYPQILPGQMATDKVIILDDTDNDGQADKSTVFADNLLIPTGIEPGDGGVYVGQSTELLHLKDTDGDGEADDRRVVMSGFGTEDTHHILHTLRWGFDGRLYFNQSIYIRTHMETPHEVLRLESGGVWRLRPETLKAEIFLRGFCNPWGHHYDSFGQSFVTDGAGGQGLSYGVPGAMYFTYARAPKLLNSVSPGRYPKFCGLELVRSPHFPDDWQGDAITCDFRAHRIVRFKISDKGSSYVTQEMPDVLRSGSVHFRPIDIKFGPDGALYIADWSNPIIQHGEVDFRDERRDHVHGRIWRVTFKDRPLARKTDLTQLDNTALLTRLVSPNGFDREKARRVLKERGADSVLPDLEKWVSAQAGEQAQLEALWIYQGLDVVNETLLAMLLEAKDGRVRTAAVQVLDEWADRIADAESRLAKRIADEHPRPRLAALRAITRRPTERSVSAALSVLDKPTDNHLDYAAWLSMREIEKPWLAMVRSGRWKPDGREHQLEFALKSMSGGKASDVLGLFLDGKAIPEDGSWIEIIGRAGTETDLSQLHTQLTDGSLSNGGRVRALNALSHASRHRNLKPGVPRESVARFFASEDQAVQVASLGLAGTWKGLGERFDGLVELASGRKSATPVRQAAINAIRETGGDRAVQALKPLGQAKQNTEARHMAVVALAALNVNETAPLAVEALGDCKSEAVALQLWRALLGVKNAESALAKALPSEQFSKLAAKAGLRAIREGGRSLQTLALALPRSAGLKDEEITLSRSEIQELTRAVGRSGDPARGEQVYRRAELGCVSCHAIGGAGGRVGPDLTSIGASAPLDYLVESLYYPNRKIKEGYHSLLVETRDNQVLFGMLEREDDNQLFLRNIASQPVTVAKANILNRTQGNSLMPSGLIDRLEKQDQIDLFSFMSRLGKPGAFDASKGNVARVWRLRAANHRDQQFGDDRIADGGIDRKRWMAVNSLVDGRLTDAMLKKGTNAGQWVGVIGVYAGTEFEVAQAGDVTLQLDGADGAKVWLDGKVVKADGQVKARLAAGKHSLVLRFDPKALPKSVKASTSQATFLVD
ncbi:MAG: c-type cytochrome [Verrucomicrobia bacterium]|nr:c-type cytochrome [Verrucomicrobiota bacterium]